MQNMTAGINWIAAIGVGVLTFVVSRRVLKGCPMLDSPVVAFCAAGLTALSLGGSGAIGVLALSYGSLGLALLFIFLLIPLLKDKKTKKDKPPLERQPTEGKEDPWEKELRRRCDISGKTATR